MKQRRKSLVALTGAAAAMIVTPFVVSHEGRELIGYRDIAGISTKCSGDTYDVVVGKRYSEAECDRSTQKQLAAHAEPVLRCTPGLKGHPSQLAAAISLAYNIGGPNYCASTVARRFNAGDWRRACDAFLMWNRANGRIVRGLVNRRRDERKLCLKDLR